MNDRHSEKFTFTILCMREVIKKSVFIIQETGAARGLRDGLNNCVINSTVPARVAQSVARSLAKTRVVGLRLNKLTSARNSM